MKQNDLNSIEILEKLDLFYNNAWEKLIIYNTILIAIIGIVIPFIIQWWQNRNLKIKEDALEKDLKKLFDENFKEFKEKMIKAVDEKFRLEVEDLIKYQDKIKAGLEGFHFHLQANSESDDKNKMKSLIWAANNYIKGDDFFNLISVLEMIITTIPRISKADVAEMSVDEADLEGLIKTLEETKNNDSFMHYIRSIKILYLKIPQDNSLKPSAFV